MKKVGLYKQDWFVALLIGIAFSAALLSGIPFSGKRENLAQGTSAWMTARSSQTTAMTNQNLRDLVQTGTETR